MARILRDQVPFVLLEDGVGLWDYLLDEKYNQKGGDCDRDGNTAGTRGDGDELTRGWFSVRAPVMVIERGRRDITQRDEERHWEVAGPV